MVLVGLLLLAVIFVAVGVALGNVGWLIASLAVSVVAAAVLLRSYLQTRRQARAAPAGAPVAEQAARAPDPATVASQPAVPPQTQVRVVDGYPEYHADGCGELAGLPAEAVPYQQAVEDGFQPCVVCNPDRALRPAAPATPVPPTTGDPPSTDTRQVLVVDGFPHYHVAGCRRLLGHEPVSIPAEQAVDDGFSPCEVCDPDAADESTRTRTAPGGDVWVVDGYPDYHRVGCRRLSGLPAEAIPREQAVEDGFAECAVCMLTTGLEPTEVWVVDGFPDYHRADCGALSGLPAEAIPLEQAVEDGFAPCPVCQSADRQVWVVDGYPDYHRNGCERLTGLPGEPVPYDQAVEDGFAPCPVCRPDDEAESPAEPEATEPQR